MFYTMDLGIWKQRIKYLEPVAECSVSIILRDAIYTVIGIRVKANFGFQNFVRF